MDWSGVDTHTYIDLVFSLAWALGVCHFEKEGEGVYIWDG